MIEVQNLRKVYGETVAVENLSFSVPAGEILGFLGPNGAGKTTTMRMLTCYTPATSGSARVAGFDVATQSREVRRAIGYLPESSPVYGEMSVKDFVGFFAETKGLTGSARRAAVGQALEECGLGSVAQRLLMNLSKGYRQRAALAQALVGDPKVLILDEPTVGLDPRQIREIRSLIRGMAGRRTVILSTHILPEISLTCSRAVIINHGRIVASGTPDNLRTEHPMSNRIFMTIRGDTEAVRATLEKVAYVRLVKIEEQTIPASHAGQGAPDPPHVYHILVDRDFDIRGDLAQAIVEKGFGLLDMRSTALSLEDVFIHAIAEDEEAARHAR